jgi:hypothetical protein
MTDAAQTWNKVVAELQALSKTPLEVTHVPRVKLEEAQAANPMDFRTTLFLGWDTGRGALPGPLANDLWPEWKPKKAIDVLGPLLDEA